MNLKDLFQGLQNEMMGKLNVGHPIMHGPTKGTGTERAWQGLFERYLPERYSVSAGIVIDSRNSSSDALDLIVYDRQYSPFILHEQGIDVIPAESVYAVFEVKQELTKDNLEYAARKVTSVRKLHRTSHPIVHAGGTHEPRTPPPILGGILATSSNWKPAWGPAFQACMTVGAKDLDIGCAVADGGFERTTEGIRTWGAENGLMLAFMATLRRLQELGTVPALDIGAYERALR